MLWEGLYRHQRWADLAHGMNLLSAYCLGHSWDGGLHQNPWSTWLAFVESLRKHDVLWAPYFSWSSHVAWSIPWSCGQACQSLGKTPFKWSFGTRFVVIQGGSMILSVRFFILFYRISYPYVQHVQLQKVQGQRWFHLSWDNSQSQRGDNEVNQIQ